MFVPYGAGISPFGVNLATATCADNRDNHGAVNRNRILSYIYADIFTDLHLLVPRVCSDAFDVQSVSGLCAEDLSYEVLAGI